MWIRVYIWGTSRCHVMEMLGKRRGCIIRSAHNLWAAHKQSHIQYIDLCGDETSVPTYCIIDLCGDETQNLSAVRVEQE